MTKALPVTEIIRHGVITEKSVALQNTPAAGTGRIVPRYTFRVALEANKFQIRQAVEQMFGVKVVKVNVMRMPGKRHTIRSRKGYFHSEPRPWKKAIVTLAEGSTIPELQA